MQLNFFHWFFSLSLTFAIPCSLLCLYEFLLMFHVRGRLDKVGVTIRWSDHHLAVWPSYKVGRWRCWWIRWGRPPRIRQRPQRREALRAEKEPPVEKSSLSAGWTTPPALNTYIFEPYLNQNPLKYTANLSSYLHITSSLRLSHPQCGNTVYDNTIK